MCHSLDGTISMKMFDMICCSSEGTLLETGASNPSWLASKESDKSFSLWNVPFCCGPFGWRLRRHTRSRRQTKKDDIEANEWVDESWVTKSVDLIVIVDLAHSWSSVNALICCCFHNSKITSKYLHWWDQIHCWTGSKYLDYYICSR